MAVELEKVERWMECFANSEIAEMNLEYDTLRLNLKKGNRKTRQKDLEKDECDAAEIEISAIDQVKAPLAGIFYRAPKPGEPPFVEVGSEVKEGDIIGLIEAMKIINEVPSPFEGVVQEILIEDGEFAEYDSVLIRIGESAHV